MQRQAVIFGVLGIALAVLLIFSLAQFAGIVPSPFARGFSEKVDKDKPAELVAVCPAADLTPVKAKNVKVNVFNATGRPGLAGSSAKQLKAAGFTVGTTDNFDAGYDGTALIRVDRDHIADGYTLGRLIDGSLVTLDDREKDGIDLILGDGFDEMAGADAIGKEPFTAPEGCAKPDEGGEPTAG